MKRKITIRMLKVVRRKRARQADPDVQDQASEVIDLKLAQILRNLAPGKRGGNE